MNEPHGLYRWLQTFLFLPEEGSTYAREVDHLHYFVILTTLIGFWIIAIVAAFFVVRYLRRAGSDDRTPVVRSGILSESLIIGIPLSLFLVWVVLGILKYIRIVSPPPNSMDVYVTGKQWMWKFAYPEGPNGIDTLRVPANRPVRLLITSRDVIHSFYVPDFRLKQDAVPGRYTQAWFEATRPGHYQILCAEFCGVGHSMMLGEVWAMDPVEFDNWMVEEKRGLANRKDMGNGQPIQASMIDQGEALSVQLECLRCHTVDGTPHIGPTWRGLYGRDERLTTGEVVHVDEAYMTESMMDPMVKIVAGYGPVMPTYQGRLDGPGAAAIVEYIKSLRTDVLQTGPSQEPTYEPIPGR